MKLLLKFFLNGNSSSYLRHLETEFGESSNAIRVELNRFEDAGLLKSFMQGNKKYYQADQSHPLFPDINNIIFKYIGIDQVIEKVVHKLGEVESVYLCGDFAQGINSDIIDLIFIGDSVNRQYLVNLVEKCEKLIKRRLRYIVYSMKEWKTAEERMNGERRCCCFGRRMWGERWLVGGSWRVEVGSWRSESRKLEVGSWRLEVGSRRDRER